jgi:membrane protein implicated in regulation of membrane protease activity
MTSAPRPIWNAAAALLLTLAVLAIGVWSGGCSDPVGVNGRCWARPSLGWPAAIVVAVVCASLAGFCIRRAVRRADPAGHGDGSLPADADAGPGPATPATGRDA